MLEIYVTNRAAFLSDIHKWSASTKSGLTLGIRKAADELAGDIAANTPSKTGKAASSVRAEMRGDYKALIGYSKEVTWYMKIVELSGAIQHPIIPRGRLGSQDARRLGAYLRRHRPYALDSKLTLDYRQANWLKVSVAAQSSSAASKRSLVSALRAAGVDEGRLSALTSKGGSLATAKRALTINGGAYSWAPHHPGIKPHFVLRGQLRASAGKIQETVREAIVGQIRE